MSQFYVAVNDSNIPPDVLTKIDVQTGISPVVPAANTITFNGATVLAGTHPVRTDGTAPATMALEVQLSQAIASTDATKVGLASFNSSDFSVDANGFVSATGSIGIQFTANDATTAVPSGGNLNVFGSVIAAGTVPVATHASGSTITTQVQKTQAIAAADATKLGISNFDSAAFDVDANGFVQLNGGGIAATAFDVDAHTAPGTDPVVPSAAGVVIVTGSSTAAGTVPVQTNSLAVNTYAIQVQKSQAIASTDATKVGLSNFNSAQFSVDANGFVSSINGGIIQTIAGDTGSITGANVTIYADVAANNSGATVEFVNSGTISTLNLTDGSDNTVIGKLSGAILGFTGSSNTILGKSNFPLATTGSFNTSIGASSLSAMQDGNQNIAIGYNTLASSVSDQFNIGIGNLSLQNMNGGINNTAIGQSTINVSTGDSDNTAIGYTALQGSSGGQNTAVGSQCMQSGSGIANCAMGYQSAFSSLNGNNNVSIGALSLFTNIAGSLNTAVGYQALQLSTVDNNTAVGYATLQNSATDIHNTAIGWAVLNAMNGGNANTAIGYSCMSANSVGSNNTAIGSAALNSGTGSSNVALGFESLNGIATGSFNIAVGDSSGNSYVGAESSNISLNSLGVVGESNTLRIGSATGSGSQQLNQAFICGIDGVNVGSVATIVTEASNQLGTAVLTAGTGITITPAANTITISASGSGFTWVDATSATQQISVETGYVTDRSGGVIYTLPLTANLGDTFKVVGKLGIATITPNILQQLIVGSTVGLAGVTGTVTSNNNGDCIEFVCITSGASTVWTADSVVGTWTVVTS